MSCISTWCSDSVSLMAECYSYSQGLPNSKNQKITYTSTYDKCPH